MAIWSSKIRLYQMGGITIFDQIPNSYPSIFPPRPNKNFQNLNLQHITIIFHFKLHFYASILWIRRAITRFSWKNESKMLFFTTFFTKLIIFAGSRWNISTNEPVLKRLLNFWILKHISRKYLVRFRLGSLPKSKILKLG